MNRKNVVILSIYLVVGAVLVVAGLWLDTDYYSTLIFATGAGLAEGRCDGDYGSLCDSGCPVCCCIADIQVFLCEDVMAVDCAYFGMLI